MDKWVSPQYGAERGQSGEKGENFLKKANGSITDIGSREVIQGVKNDSVIIKRPEGGGYGE